MALTKYICLICGHHFGKRTGFAMASCPQCKGEAWWEGSSKHSGENNIRRKPLTEWQKKKLSWYRDERKWHDDIRGRVIQKDGSVAVYDGKGHLKEVRPKDGN